MDSTCTIRQTRPEDLDRLAELYAHHWCNHIPSREDRLLASRHCVALYLVRSPLTLVAEREGEVVGVCLGGVNEGGTAPVVDAWLPAYEAIHAQALERAKTADEDLEGSLFDDQRELDLADDFIRSGSPLAEAQVNLFMVAPWLKGQGLGTLLFDRMRELMRAQGAEHFFLMTDTGCDYAYYDHCGMNRIAQRPSDPNDPTSWLVLMYAGDL